MDPARPEFTISRKGYDREEVDAFVESNGRELAAARRRIEKLEAEVRELAADNERLESISTRATDVTTELHAALERATAAEEQLAAARENEEAVRLMLTEASKTRQAMLTEAENQIQDSKHEAEIEASHVVEQAFTRARAIVDDARDKAEAVREAQAAEVEGLQYMRTVYDELAETLQMVAKAAIDELSRSRAPLDELLMDAPGGDGWAEHGEAMAGTAEAPVVDSETESPVPNESPATVHTLPPTD